MLVAPPGRSPLQRRPSNQRFCFPKAGFGKSFVFSSCFLQDRIEQKRLGQLCKNYLVGCCTFGDACRFNHDIPAYLRTKPADLPGKCIFLASGPCPYGITCRWASSHPDHQQHLPAPAPADQVPTANPISNLCIETLV